MKDSILRIELNLIRTHLPLSLQTSSKSQYYSFHIFIPGSVMGLRWLQTGHRDLNTMLPRVVYKQIQPQATGQVDFICRCVIGMYGESRNECQITNFVDEEY